MAVGAVVELAAGGAAKLEGAVGHAEPARGALQVPVLGDYRVSHGDVFGSAADILQPDTPLQGATDRALEGFVAPIVRVALRVRALVLGDVADGDRARPDVPAGDPRDQLAEVAHVSGIRSPEQVLADGLVQLDGTLAGAELRRK